jgi:hypothetical protein
MSEEDSSTLKADSSVNSESSNTHGGVYTAFTAEEEAWFSSSFGFVIPFIQNKGYGHLRTRWVAERRINKG